MRTVFKNFHIVDPSQDIDGIFDMLIEDERVLSIGKDLPVFGAKIVESNGLFLAPGLVDLHVHLRDPGQTEKEDAFTASNAAAAGGVTSLLAMPNTSPPMDDPKLLKSFLEKVKTANAHIYQSACVTKGLMGEELTDFAALSAAGARAVSDDGKPVKSASCLLEALKTAPKFGMILCAHCEETGLSSAGIMREGKTSAALSVRGIPSAAEYQGVAREVAAAESLNMPIHICHVSTKESVKIIRGAKRRGVRVTAETCPHYLLLTDDALKTRDADFRMNPPLGSEEDRQALIEALLDGTIDCISTDHAPHTAEEKADFEKAPNGVIGMETSFSATLTALLGKMDLSSIIYRMSTSPAKILGIPAGTLSPGSPADFFLFDPGESYILNPANLHGKSRNTPFKNMRLRGRVHATYLSGKNVFEIQA